ncbi:MULTISPECIES: 6,7-dimethyl-8-ribityllumazine synthase [Halococcus]|uniref:6,7-dimethyl-8-ribityllumazine synthase n=1 Tax=Halococcus salifodinae DSM 8989 TaxID=1227456 RepID=M0N1A3_9EURY|nr:MULTISPECIES: 6,7-dimethyl-8-ribityllumazine synthase [Halococcus]EMA50884.1 6,7-dimethyl-8-ribityllumazine synthase [Halococcus salifodinae DSM 8989]
MHSLGLVVAQFYDDLTTEMEEHAHEAAAECGAEITDTIPVPGAYDAPLAADRLARRDEIAAVAVLGAIVSGDTDHDQVIARSAAKGLTDVSLDRDKPVTFGVVGPGMSGAEARERADKGAEAVTTAVDMVEALA